MSPDPGGIFDTLLGLVRRGLGGPSGDGRQFVSWVHHVDFTRAIYWLIDHDEIDGPVNIASPHPLPNAEFMRAIRNAWGIGVGLPASRWMLEIGAVFLRTETELILKSRRVTPGRLLQHGFEFRYPTWPEAARQLCQAWRGCQPQTGRPFFQSLFLFQQKQLNIQERRAPRVETVASRECPHLFSSRLGCRQKPQSTNRKGNIMYTVWTYLIYLVVSVGLTVWVARTLFTNGRVFLVDAFSGNELLADSVNQLLVVGFYLINAGFVAVALKYGEKPQDLVHAIEFGSMKIGMVLLVVGAMHFMNLYLLAQARHRGIGAASLREEH
jgi:hypothetical protein